MSALNQLMEKNLPPAALESEKGLLGAILLNKEIMLQVADILVAEHFYDDVHQAIFRLMQSLWERQQNIDILVILERAKQIPDEERKKQNLDQLDKTFLLDLTAYASLIGNPNEHAEIIKEKHILRSLVKIGDEIKNRALEQKDEVSEQLDLAENRIFKLANTNLQQDFATIGEIMHTTMERIEDLYAHKDQMRGIPTGFADLDKILGGFQNSDLIIIAARPSMGKTAFALSLAVNIAVKRGIGVAIFSLEMSRDQLTDRMLSKVSNVELHKIRRGDLRDDPHQNDFMKIGRGISELAESPVWIDDSGSLNVSELRTKCRRIKSKHGVGLIIIDYLQLMSGRANYGQNNRVQEISEITRSLKSLARELNVPIIALSQLSRGVESRDDKRPMLSDLRESGSIEQDADIVTMLYRPYVYERDKYEGKPPQERIEAEQKAEIIIAKHRNGATGKINLHFRKEMASFENSTDVRVSYRVPGE
jgi:replicative DNA helicase